MSKDAHASQALSERLGRLHSAGGFWREHWGRTGTTSAPESLSRLPLVTAADLAADEVAHPPFGSWRAARGFVRVGVPSRTSPLEMVVFSAQDLAREARVGASALRNAGLAPGMRETNTLPGGLATPGSLVVGDAAEALGALDMPVGPIDAEGPGQTAYDFWSRVRPDFAVLDVGGVRALAALLQARASTAEALGLAGAVVLTDVRDPEPDVPALGIPTRRVVGLAEAFSLLAARDADGAYHPPSDEVLVEVLDGELALTCLRHDAALIRFAPGVRAELVRRRGASGVEEAGFRLV